MDIVLTPDPCKISLTPQRPGIVFEGPPDSPGGRTVDYHPPSGGLSRSSTDSTGAFETTLAAPLDVGRPNERLVVKVLVQKLREEGRDVRPLAGAVDGDGEDGKLEIDGRPTVIQVVSMPCSLWRDLADRGEAFLAGDLDQAVDLVRVALKHKRPSAKHALVVVDAFHLGAVISPKLVGAYRDLYGDPAVEFGFFDVWVLGPTVASSLRLAN